MCDVPEVIARGFLVSGRVQGVGFRAATAEAATVRGLVGWVRNRPDGRVEIRAQGPADTIAEFARWVDNGPRWARVTSVEYSEAEVEIALDRFSIRW